jgi:hypothetical protein
VSAESDVSDGSGVSEGSGVSDASGAREGSGDSDASGVREGFDALVFSVSVADVLASADSLSLSEAEAAVVAGTSE